jgi:hypothetical protein
MTHTSNIGFNVQGYELFTLLRMVEFETPLRLKIPVFQRQYNWGKSHQIKLLNNILSSNTNRGHFIGTIFTIIDNDSREPQSVIDGQQRITTLCLIILAVAKHLYNQNDKNDHKTIKRLINYLYYKGDSLSNFTFKDTDNKPTVIRFNPGKQSDNDMDYYGILNRQIDMHLELNGTTETIKINQALEPGQMFVEGDISDAFEHIESWIKKELTSTSEIREFINNLEKIRLIQLSVDPSQNPTELFDGLNNTGLALSISDIVKNTILSFFASITPDQQITMEDAFSYWTEIVDKIDDDYHTLFLKHSLYTLITVDKFTISPNNTPTSVSHYFTERNLPDTYSSLLSHNSPINVLRRLSERATAYKTISSPIINHSNSNLYENVLYELKLVEADPSYVLIFYLANRGISEQIRIGCIKTLIKLYVRQHLTDLPKISRLDNHQSNLVQQLHQLVDADITIDSLEKLILGYDENTKGWTIPRNFASLDELRSKLEGPIYKTDKNMTRYLLIKLRSLYDVSRENYESFRSMDTQLNKRTKLYTIEHVMPQSSGKKGLSPAWKTSIQRSCKTQNADEINQLHTQHVHLIGNLTLSAVNSRLSDKPFTEKQVMQTIHPNPQIGPIQIGLKNGDPLNTLEFNYNNQLQSLANIEDWGIEEINSRTKKIVEVLLAEFAFQHEKQG